MNDFKSKFLFVFFITILTLLFFHLGRIFLLINYSSIFTLTNIQILKSFLSSIQFDLSIIMTFYCAPFILFFLPIKSIRYYKIIIFLIYLMFLFMLMIMVGDLIYFQESKAHITEEIFLALNDLPFLVSYSVQKFWWLLILLFSSFLFIYICSVKIFKKIFHPKQQYLYKNILILLTISCLLFFAIRGKISGMLLGITDIYTLTTNIQEINLILNGVFTGTHTLFNNNNSLQNNMNAEEAYQNIRNLLFGGSA